MDESTRIEIDKVVAATLRDIRGEGHVFHATSFYNQHDLLTFIVHIRKLKS